MAEITLRNRKPEPALGFDQAVMTDWTLRLLAFVERHRGRRFDWRKRNCALMAADWVKVVSGQDPAAAFRGKFHDRNSARAALVAAGFRDLEQAVNAALGAPLKSPLFAQRGDVVSIKLSWSGISLGICLGITAAFPAPDKGLVEHRLRQCRKAWRVDKLGGAAAVAPAPRLKMLDDGGAETARSVNGIIDFNETSAGND